MGFGVLFDRMRKWGAIEISDRGPLAATPPFQGFDSLGLSLGSKIRPKTVPK
jgi:hypothetical protein